VALASSDPSAATVVSSVIIPANQPSVNFQVFAVHDTSRGTTDVTITATASGFTGGAQVITITESDFPWQNPSMPIDVSGDGRLSPVDALLVINYLNTPGRGNLPSGSPPPFLDVSGDNKISPEDALIVINALNSRVSGEGEASVKRTPAVSSASLVDLAFAQGAFDDLTEGFRGRKRQLLK
jgi:hypothetical protein